MSQSPEVELLHQKKLATESLEHLVKPHQTAEVKGLEAEIPETSTPWGIMADCGSSNIKMLITSPDGKPIANFSINVAEAFLEDGLIDVEYYAGRFFYLFKTIISHLQKRSIDLTQLSVFTSVGVVPSTLLFNLDQQPYDKFGLSYTSQVGQAALEDLRLKTLLEQRGQIAPGPSLALETLHALAEEGLLNEAVRYHTLMGGIIELIAQANTPTVAEGAEHAGLVDPDGSVIYPPSLDQNTATQIIGSVEPVVQVGEASQEFLQWLGLDPKNKLELLNAAVDGPAIHALRVRVNGDLRPVARISLNTTSVVSVPSEEQIVAANQGLWCLNPAWLEGYVAGASSNWGGASFQKLLKIKDNPLIELLITNEQPSSLIKIYQKYLAKLHQSGELDMECLRQDGLDWYQEQVKTAIGQGKIDAFFINLPLLIPSTDRDGHGQTKIVGNLPTDPRCLYFLIEEAIIFAIRYRWESLIKQGKIPEDLNYAVLGKASQSPLWVALLHANLPDDSIANNLGTLQFDNQNLSQPTLIALAIISLQQQGKRQEAEALMNRLTLKTLNRANPEKLFFYRETEKRRYILFLEAMGYIT